MSDIVFEGIRHYAQQCKKGEIVGSNILFDIFNTYRRLEN